RSRGRRLRGRLAVRRRDHLQREVLRRQGHGPRRLSGGVLVDDVVVLAPGAEENGLACMLAELLRENIQKPEKEADFRELGLAIGIVAKDAEISLTLDFDRGRCTIYDGVRPGASIIVTTDSERITKMSLLPIASLPRIPLPIVGDLVSKIERWTGPLAMPNFFSPEGKEMFRDMISGALKIDGAVRHPIALTRLTRLLSVA